MKRISVFLLFCLLIAGISVAADYNILNCGAKNGQLSTSAIQKAVDECSAAGGGRVVVPAGTFIAGTVFMKSNVNLYLENGAVLQGSKDLKDYSRDGRSPGNFDLRPATPKAMQILEHDIPGIYAQHINGLTIRDFQLSWGNDLPSFFTKGIECDNVTDLLINNFVGSGNPNTPESEKVKLVNSAFRK